MIYLTAAEIPEYCGLAADVTMTQVEAASALIDAYKGCSLEPREHTERVELRCKRRDTEGRGKLIHLPRIEVTDVKANVAKDSIPQEGIIVKRGKKNFRKVVIK